MQKYLGNNRKITDITNLTTTILFILYLIVLFYILLFKLGVHFSNMGKMRSINFIPFNQISMSDMILNVVIFIPLGLYAGVLFKRGNFVKMPFFFFLISLTIEVLQFIFRLGVADITDVITNTLGGIIGLMLYKLIEKLFTNNVKAQKVINILAAIGTILTISFLILIKTNNPLIRYR